MNQTCRDILYDLSSSGKIKYFDHVFPMPFKLEKRLRDVLEDEVDEKYYIDSAKFNYDGGNQLNPQYESQGNTIFGDDGVSPTLCAFTHGYAQGYLKEQKGVVVNREPKILAMRGRNPQNPKSRKSGLDTVQMLEYNDNGTSNCLSTVQKDNLLDDGARIRKLTPKECWRLQGFPDWAHDKAKEAGVSDSQRYKQAGNSITVNVMMHLVSSIFESKKTGGLF